VLHFRNGEAIKKIGKQTDKNISAQSHGGHGGRSSLCDAGIFNPEIKGTCFHGLESPPPFLASQWKFPHRGRSASGEFSGRVIGLDVLNAAMRFLHVIKPTEKRIEAA
jgi:hypothetical protein